MTSDIRQILLGFVSSTQPTSSFGFRVLHPTYIEFWVSCPSPNLHLMTNLCWVSCPPPNLLSTFAVRSNPQNRSIKLTIARSIHPQLLYDLGGETHDRAQKIFSIAFNRLFVNPSLQTVIWACQNWFKHFPKNLTRFEN